MRLLEYVKPGSSSRTYTFSLIERNTQDLPQYAILSHRWGADEVTFKDVHDGTIDKKEGGYKKLQFCAARAERDGLLYFWVDTCCIDKSSSAELSEAINSMYKWYQKAAKCYVYLPDVSAGRKWKGNFSASDWFRRGWTLQELVAPQMVEFFSKEGTKLGDKKSLVRQLQQVTSIPIEALQGKPLTEITEQERFSWAKHRETTVDEDVVYCLLGIFNVHMPLIYGEGRQKALMRLHREIRLLADSDLRGSFDSLTINPSGPLFSAARLPQDRGLETTKFLASETSESVANSGELRPGNTGQRRETAATPDTFLAQQSPAVSPCLSDCPNTASIPFSAVIGKEIDGQTLAYQTITFQALYHEYSLEEIRLADSVQQSRTKDSNLAGCPGTGIVPFFALTERDTNGQTLAYQTITLHAPYQKYSLDELRLADSRALFSIRQMKKTSEA
ncbi:hypothetical protein LTS08_008867 [Lithohypha guttulata]|uniref:Heterokaryon incompatibility domain-containing protein n=1 Tax=Lithohypha guttulata TaxID=1690604 RepID=A0AAN7PJD9_9EURO|nr:hypothetical protein LTR05_008816 [Lithohypha guttulata]KAK5093650.1 hypothetical protein LTS08_008867 [Lithohypha guttulata]